MSHRRVVGHDYLVSCTRTGKPVITLIDEKLTVDSLSSHPFKAPFQFIANFNVNNLPQQLRGCIVCIPGQIAVIVKARMNIAIALQVLPQSDDPCFHLIRLDEIVQGFYLQQVSGVPIQDVVSWQFRQQRTHCSPESFCAQERATKSKLDSFGFIKMSIDGPDAIDLSPIRINKYLEEQHPGLMERMNKLVAKTSFVHQEPPRKYKRSKKLQLLMLYMF